MCRPILRFIPISLFFCGLLWPLVSGLLTTHSRIGPYLSVLVAHAVCLGMPNHEDFTLRMSIIVVHLIGKCVRIRGL